MGRPRVIKWSELLSEQVVRISGVSGKKKKLEIVTNIIAVFPKTIIAIGGNENRIVITPG